MQPENFYHIYNHANGSENLFISDENYRYFLKQYSLFSSDVVDTFAYCLLPNHFHILVRVKKTEELKEFWNQKYKDSGKTLQGFETLEELVVKQFSHFFNSYTQAFNKMWGRKGSLFRHPFKRKKIGSDNYLTKVIHYIHVNPVHHGFVKDLCDWQHSSFHAHLSFKESRLKREYVIGWFGGIDKFRQFHKNLIDEELILEME